VKNQITKFVLKLGKQMSAWLNLADVKHVTRD